jgi:type III pantothenate kinase
VTPDVVVDIGNTRMKWGRDYSTDWLYMINTFRRLNHDDPDQWAAAAGEWSLATGTRWVVSGVNPPAQERFVAWCRGRGDEVRVIDRYDQIPIAVEVDEPHRVGLDRLFGALAAANYYPGVPCVVIDVGTAMTVNFVVPDRRFVGGAILPGPRLMAKALNDYTAQLPRIDPEPLDPKDYKWDNTEAAIATGINAAVVGAARALLERFAADHPGRFQIYWTGGDMRSLMGLPALDLDASVLPAEALTLTGIRIAAEALP